MANEQQQYFDDHYKERKNFLYLSFCDECNEETVHEESSGHNGWDSWSSFDCLKCEIEDPKEYAKLYAELKKELEEKK